jgi:hypothetical protein
MSILEFFTNAASDLHCALFGPTPSKSVNEARTAEIQTSVAQKEHHVLLLSKINQLTPLSITIMQDGDMILALDPKNACFEKDTGILEFGAPRGITDLRLRITRENTLSNPFLNSPYRAIAVFQFDDNNKKAGYDIYKIRDGELVKTGYRCTRTETYKPEPNNGNHDELLRLIYGSF